MINRWCTMTNEELVELYQNGDARSLEELVKKNDGLVHTIARKFNTENIASIDYDDLLQEGRMGLMVAASKYNLGIENRAAFSTYAIHWIRQKISRFIQYKDTTKEISLNKPAYGEDEVEIGDTIPSEHDDICNIEDSVYYQEIHDEIEQVMRERLTLKQRQVVQFRYGFDSKECTLSEVGELFNLSIERIRQIEKESLRKMKNSTWGMRMKKERYIEQHEHLLSPGANGATEKYALFTEDRVSALDILKRVQAQREQTKARLIM